MKCRLFRPTGLNDAGRVVAHWYCRRCGARVRVAWNFCYCCDFVGVYPDGRPFTRAEWEGW